MPAEHPSELTPKQDEGILALLNQPTIQKAAEAIGVDERTIRRWMAQPLFARKYRAAQRDTFKQAIAMTQRCVPHAVQVLMKVAQDQSAPAAARVSAATALLRFSRESIELDDLASRLDALEAATSAPSLHQLPPHQRPPPPEPLQEAA